MPRKSKIKDKELLKHDPYCPECNSWYTSDPGGKLTLKYCKDCGAELILPSRCVFCGSVILAPAKFCPGCGRVAIS